VDPFAVLLYHETSIMPATYNSLIRYKTIDTCLYGGRRGYSINELIDECTAALSAATDRSGKVSERTLQNDIRIMRSDILGFNAPISRRSGLYYYDDPEYSIATLSLTDSAIIERIIEILLGLRKNISNPELESLLLQMLPLAGPEFIQKFDLKGTLPQQPDRTISRQNYNYNHINWRLSSHFEDYLEDIFRENDLSNQNAATPESVIIWERILNLLPGSPVI
jgi:hypothetical protein